MALTRFSFYAQKTYKAVEKTLDIVETAAVPLCHGVISYRMFNSTVNSKELKESVMFATLAASNAYLAIKLSSTCYQWLKNELSNYLEEIADSYLAEYDMDMDINTNLLRR